MDRPTLIHKTRLAGDLIRMRVLVVVKFLLVSSSPLLYFFATSIFTAVLLCGARGIGARYWPLAAASQSLPAFVVIESRMLPVGGARWYLCLWW